jgi:hypothetical protein
MLGGSIVTTAWHILRLRMEGRPPAWGLGVGLTTSRHKHRIITIVLCIRESYQQLREFSLLRIGCHT